MRTVPVFIVLMLMPVLVGCFGQEVYIVVENRSDDSLYVCLKENYADTLLPGNKYFHSGYLTPVSGSSNILKFSYWGMNEHDFDEPFGDSDTISLFFVRWQVINQLPYWVVRENSMILARYDITRPIVEHFDGKFVYPPTQQLFDAGVKVFIAPDGSSEWNLLTTEDIEYEQNSNYIFMLHCCQPFCGL